MEGLFFVNVITPLCLALIMFGMGMSLELNDFKRTLGSPKAIFIGILGQICLLPATGFLLAVLLPIPAEMSVGIMVLTACAGGATSNLLVYLSRGDVALSVTLTAISCIITVITIPFIVNFALFYFMGVQSSAALPVGATNLKLFVITLLPVLMGLGVRRRFRAFSKRAEKPLSRLSGLFFVLLLGAILFQNRDGILDALITAGPVTYLLNTITMAMGYSMASFGGLKLGQRISISLEIGVQNSATGILIATLFLQNPQIALVPSLYSSIMYINAGLLIGWMRRR